MDGAECYFKYEPLTKPDSIRLFILQPGSPGHTIHGSLVHTTLAQCHYDIYSPYTALSYVWGDAKNTVRIFIDTQPFTVTVNLASALDSMRDERVAICVWADAVCIDQSNIPERNQQVGLMRDVYSFAQQTIVYLGEADSESWEVFNALRRQRSDSDESTLPGLIQDLAAVHILSRPWFTRVWIYQELVLSREVWIQLGRDRMLWDDFCDPLIRFYTPDVDEDVNTDEEDADGVQNIPENVRWNIRKNVQSNLTMLSKMHEARQSFRKSKFITTERPVSLLSVLESRRGFQVTDLRDMVYGHLAMADVYVGPLVVDYNKSVAEVFIDAACYIVDNKNFGCAILSGVEMLHSNSRIEGLPSWVPDWS
jgi:hypothetical protein